MLRAALFSQVLNREREDWERSIGRGENFGGFCLDEATEFSEKKGREWDISEG